jgi:hypothetical protein
MTEKQARQEGLMFTGSYLSWKKEEIKNDAAEIRKQGFRAVVVITSGGGYSVYAEKKYFTYRRIKDIEMHLSNFGEWKKRAYDEYQKRLKEIDDKIKRLQDELVTLKKSAEKED